MSHTLQSLPLANIIPSREELEKILAADRKLNVYLGIDPTATRITLGHAVPLRILNHFAQAGHNVTFLIGDFTALIGDTSDKDTERPVLSTEQIQQNFQTYQQQASKILDFSKVKVRYNSEWLSQLSFADIVKYCQHFSTGDFVSRELIKKRLTEGKKVGLHELLYPVMQGYDSYYMDTDIQIGGTDQTFNMQAGRVLQKDLRNKESFVITNLFLTGTDGRKMSKSWGNAIWLDDPASEVYGKTMSIPDTLILEYFTLATSLPTEEISIINNQLSNNHNPMDLKKRLAWQITSELHSPEAANEAQTHFENTVQNKQIPNDIETFSPPISPTPIDLLMLTNLAQSRGEARRLIEQGGFRINGQTATDANQILSLKPGDIIQAGKRNFRKII